LSARNIVVVPYDPSWIDNFDRERTAILATPGLDAVVHHIGSTAVVGLAAKPIIDILLDVDDITRLNDLNAHFTRLGYTPRGENGIPGRHYFVKGSPERSHHLHAFAANSHHALRHLAFRDFLRRHAELRDQYAAVKQNAAKTCGNNSETYAALKDDFVRQLEAMAMAEQPASE
jgi:GrpB-like predicted nucleotidyltransferase (UPF0157 family)